tara:strand:- start:217 stop:489 length:273 start_codon:yes stop_codon:yes gene_type:complete
MADYKKEVEKIKKKNKPLTITGAGFSPQRMIARAIENRRRKKKSKKEIDALPMKVDDFQEDHELRKIKKRLNLAKGGVVPGRGGEFKGVR